MSNPTQDGDTQGAATLPQSEQKGPLFSPPGGSWSGGFTDVRGTSRVRVVLDALAKHVISAGGIAVIVSILAIFLFLVYEVLPLFQPAKTTRLAIIDLPTEVPSNSPVEIGLDEHREVAFLLTSAGVRFVGLQEGTPLKVDIPAEVPAGQITAIAKAGARSSRYLVGTEEGLVVPLQAGVATEFSESGERLKRPFLVAGAPLRIGKNPITALAYRAGDSGIGILALDAQGAVVFVRAEEENPAGSPAIPLPAPSGRITALALDEPLLNAYLGTADGRLHHLSLEHPDKPYLVGSYLTEAQAPVSRLDFLVGDRSLLVLTAAGSVSTWVQTRHPIHMNQWVLSKNHSFQAHQEPVTASAPSGRDKGFITGDHGGHVFVHYATSERTLLRLPGEGGPIRALVFAPKADGLLTFHGNRTLTLHALHNPHPEVTLRTLFGKVWYEGYDKPAYVWQSSSGSDDFEPKLSLIPLAFGTLKGTIYALLLAIPLAILAAIFTSQFMHPNLRATIKPAIEVMAALPTVVLGFVAGLWLAPFLERLFPAFVGMLIAIPFLVLLVSGLWNLLPPKARTWVQPGSEALLLIPLLAGTIAICLGANDALEHWLFAGDFQTWLSDKFNVRYDQRNAVVVGIVMGFAVIPLIYSISEEALTNVPRHLIAGSLALGATRWQTVTYLVILAASPGIFSAIMIGFGRAIGETMIVLMATGNTPIMDWSWFNGFRTLSANIAVEIPEAPHGGTLYRVLFLAALLLFLLTFAINTLAELVRRRLRKRYSHL